MYEKLKKGIPPGFQGLAREAIDSEKFLYKIRPKVHQPFSLIVLVLFWVWCVCRLGFLRTDHLCIDQAQVMNPFMLSTYDDEDYVGKCKQLAIRSTAQNLGYQILQRYAAYVCCRWLRQCTS